MNQGFCYRVTVPEQAHGLDAATWLALRFTHTNAETWGERLAAGQIAAGGTVQNGSFPLQRGQLIEWTRPPWTEPDVPCTFGVVHEDTALLVVNKPSGLPTMPAGGFYENTLLCLVRLRWPTASPVHRLGRGTSGLVAFALTPAAASALTRDLREHRVEKHYVARISGRPPWNTLRIEAPIGPVDHPRLGKVFAASPAGKPARTDVCVLGQAAAELTRISAQIFTGRPHQIRIHLAWAGYPLAGDPLYGPGGTPRTDALPGELGYLLHAERLVLTHPTLGVVLSFSADGRPYGL